MSSALCVEFEGLGQGQTHTYTSPGLGRPEDQRPSFGTLCRKVWSGRALQRQKVELSHSFSLLPWQAQLLPGK